MAQYRVTLPDGSQYKVDAPEGTSEQAIRYAAQKFARDDELRTAQERLASLRNAPVAPTPVETSVGGNVLELLKGIIPGAAGLVETAGTGISALFPEGAEKATREGLRSFREAVSEPFAPGAGYEESVGRKLGEGLGSTLPFFLLGGRGAAPRVAGAGIGASAGAGEARQAAEQAGATEEQRRQATLMGIGPGLFDIVTPEVGRGIQNVMARALVRGGVEGATEAAQRIAQNLIAQGVYNPNQPLLAGSGEEGAYGAGVGALASLIIDTTLGRRARGAPPTSATPQAAQAPAAPGAPAPAAPELPSTVPPSFEYPQGELFARDLSVARRQQAEQAGARPEFELTSPEAPRGEQLELPFGEPAAAPAPGQRDLIDESETAQIREMLDQDETQQIQDLLAVDQQREEEARAQQEKLRFESSLAETDARRVEAERRKTEDHRLEILRTIIAEPSVKNVQATFGDALKVAGYTDTAFTPRERQMIQRANDVRAAQPAAPEAIPSAPAELGAMEALIPERRTQPPEAPRAAEPVPPPSRASVPVAGQPSTGGPAAGVGVTEPARVVPPQQNVEQPVGGEGAKPGAVTARIPSERQERIAFGKAIGAAQPYPGSLQGRQNQKAQTAAKQSDFPAVVTALESSKSPVVQEVARRAKNLGTKIVIDDNAAELYAGKSSVMQQLSIDGAKMHLEALGKIRELAPTIDALPDGAKIPLDVMWAKIAGVDQGKDVGQIRLEDIAKMGHSMFAPLPSGPLKLDTKEDFKQLQRQFEELTTEIDEDKLQLTSTGSAEMLGVAGVYDADTDTIRVPEYAAKREDVLAHEIVHAQAAKAVASPTAEQRPAVNRLNNLYRYVKNQLEQKAERDKNYRMPYGLSSIQEFLAEGMANPAFQFELNKIEYENTTAWDKFVQTIADLIGVKNNTAFTELLSIYSSLVPSTSAAQAPAPAPAAQAPAAPAAPKFTPQQMLERAEEAQRKADEAAAAAKPAKAPAPAKPAKPAKPGVLDQAREGYLLAAKGNADKALDYLAHDMAIAMYPEKNVAKELNKLTLDLAADKITDPKFLKRDEVYAPNTGGKYAKAFFESLSLQEYKVLTAKLRNIFQDYARTELRMNNADLAASARKLEALNQNDQTTYGLNLEAPILGMRMHPAVQDRISSGDLVGALRVMAGLSEGTISTAATRVAEYIGTTKVEVQSKVTDEAGKAVAGRFDPKTNTIYLNSSMGMSGHTLLHEGVHAVTSHILANPSHPVTRQLTALYKNALPYLDTAYGARSLDEFVAEAFSNPQFQEKLAGIPTEGNTTVFQRFIRAVQNLVRRMMSMDAKPMESVMDATDRLVMEIMAPAPDSRGAGSLYAAAATGQAERTLDVYGANAMAAPTLTQERLYKFREFFQGTAPDAAKNLMRASLPLNALEDLARSRIPAATRIATLIDERAGSENKRNQLIEPVVKRTTDWAATNEAKVDSLNSVIYNSTLYQVDPSKPRTDYAGKVDESGNKLDAVWDFLQPKWRELGEDGRSIYKQMRDTYATLHKDVERVLFNRIDDALKDDPEAAKSTKAEIYKRLFAGGKIEPYFPLTRTGKYWMSYTADGEFYVEAFETSAMREDAIKELRGTQGVDGKTIQKFANVSQINYRNVPATSFVNNILQTMEASKKGASAETKAKIDETISGVMNLFLNTLPETSFAQSFRRRKGTLGFKQDAVRALRSKSYSLSRQLANIEYGAKLESARRDMQEHIKANGSQEQDVAYMEEFNKRIDFAISPNVPEWSKWLTSAGFAMTLGFNVSSAVVNLAQIPIVVMPYLGGRYGYGATTAAVGRATRIFTGSGFSREAEMLVPVKDDKGNEVEKSLKVRAAPSIDNYDFNDPKNKDIKHLETLVRVAGSRGQLNRSMSYDVLEVDKNESITSRINKYSGFVFHHGERMNRQVAMVTAYELELNRLNKPGAKLQEDLLTPQGVLPKGMLASSLSTAQREEYAANQAIYLTEMTNGGTSAASAPRIAQGGIGRVVFMYKRYGASMYYMMFKNLRQVIDKETDPEVRSAALKQLVGIQASAALFAGAKGLTAYGIAAAMFNLFRDEDEDDFDTLARKSMPEWAYSGALNYLTGAEISSRVGLSDLLFRDSAVPSPNTGLAVLAEQLGGPVWGIGNRVIRGLQLINEGNVERGVEQIVPSAVASGLKALRFAQEGALTLRGDPVIQEFGAGQIIGQAFGFTPAEYTRQLEINSAEKKIDRAANEEKTKLLRQYYIALRMGDQSGVQSTAEKMQKFNTRHPSNAITTDTIANSLAQHMKTSREMVSGVLYSKNMRPEIMRELARFEEGDDEE